VVDELDRLPTASATLCRVISSNVVSAPMASTNTAAATAATRPQRSLAAACCAACSSAGVSSSAAATGGVPTAAGAVTKVDLIFLLPRSIQRW
jgi:hypothetical protein